MSDEFPQYNPEPVEVSDDFTRTDFELENHGSIYILYPQNDSARAWLDEHVYSDDAPTWHGGGIVVEPRYVGDLLDGIDASGLTVDV